MLTTLISAPSSKAPEKVSGKNETFCLYIYTTKANHNRILHPKLEVMVQGSLEHIHKTHNFNKIHRAMLKDKNNLSYFIRFSCFVTRSYTDTHTHTKAVSGLNAKRMDWFLASIPLNSTIMVKAAAGATITKSNNSNNDR